MDIVGKKISILGAVRSGVSAARLALASGAVPFVSDMGENENVINNKEKLANLGIAVEIGGHSSKVYDCDFIITSPGVPTNSDVLLHALDKNIKVLFAGYYPVSDKIFIIQ